MVRGWGKMERGWSGDGDRWHGDGDSWGGDGDKICYAGWGWGSDPVPVSLSTRKAISLHNQSLYIQPFVRYSAPTITVINTHAKKT